MNQLNRWIVTLLAGVLVACGGGGGGDAQPVVAAARVEITQTGLVLTAAGASAQLSATVFDAGGAKIDAPVSWSSSRPGTVTVDAQGRVVAVGTGATQVVARSGSLQSAPLLVLVAAVVPGAVLLDDAQIVGEPVETDPDAAPSRSNTFRIQLAAGVTLPDVGTLMGASGSKTVAGRVVAVDTVARSVTLEPVSPRLILPGLRIDEVIDLRQAEVVIPPDIAARYEVRREGGTLVYTPRPGVAATRARPLGAATGTHALPPFEECTTSITGVGDDAALPIVLPAPPEFSFTMPNSLEYVDTPENGVEKLLVNGEPVFKVEVSLGVTAAFEGKVECEGTMGIITIPVGGLLAWVAGGQIPYGMGIELSGKLTLATMSIGAKAEVKTTTKLGFQCAAATGCDFVAEIGDFVPTTEWISDGPSVGDFRVDASAAAFGFAKANFGSRLKRLQVEGFKAKLGGKLTGSFAPQLTQIIDTSYKSDYKLSVEASAEAGRDLEGLLTLLGVSSVNTLELSTSLDLARSPTGTVTADRKVFTVGDHVTFSVNLDNVEFIPGSGRYNVDHVLLIRNSGGTRSVVGRVDASNGQRVFDFGFDATGPGTVGEFFAFVVTKILPVEFASLEVAAAAPPTVTVVVNPPTKELLPGDTATFAATVGGTAVTGVVWSANAGVINDLGVFTAPAQSATVLVTATSVADPAVFAQAVVTVGAPGVAARWGGTITTTFTQRLSAPNFTRDMFMNASYEIEFEADGSQVRLLRSEGTGGSTRVDSTSSTFGHPCVPPSASWTVRIDENGTMVLGINGAEHMDGYISTTAEDQCDLFSSGQGPFRIPGYTPAQAVVVNNERVGKVEVDTIESGVLQGENTRRVTRPDPSAGIENIFDFSIRWSFAPR